MKGNMQIRNELTNSKKDFISSDTVKSILEIHFKDGFI